MRDARGTVLPTRLCLSLWNTHWRGSPAWPLHLLVLLHLYPAQSSPFPPVLQQPRSLLLPWTLFLTSHPALITITPCTSFTEDLREAINLSDRL